MLIHQEAPAERFLHQVICLKDLLLVFIAQPREPVRKIKIPKWTRAPTYSVLTPGTAVGVARRGHQEQIDQARLQLPLYPVPNFLLEEVMPFITKDIDLQAFESHIISSRQLFKVVPHIRFAFDTSKKIQHMH